MGVDVLCLRRGEGAPNGRIGAEGSQPYGGDAACCGSRDTVRGSGFLAFGGLRHSVEPRVSCPLPRGGGLGALPAWPPRGRGTVGGEGVCRARWPDGLHVRDKGPAPGRGRGAPGGGAERRLRPSLGGPLPFPPGSRRTPRRGLTSVPPRSRVSREGQCSSALHNPVPDTAASP